MGKSQQYVDIYASVHSWRNRKIESLLVKTVSKASRAPCFNLKTTATAYDVTHGFKQTWIEHM